MGVTDADEAAAASASAGNKNQAVSIVQMTMENKQYAEDLISKLFKELLIADSQIFENNERLVMKYRKQLDLDGQVKIKLTTTTEKLPYLISFINNNNPNSLNTDIAADIVAT